MLGDICILSLLFQCLEMLFREHIHPVFAFLKRKDYYSQPDSSLQTKSSRQGCIAPGFFIPADKIFSAGMHRPRIFHPCRQNLLGRDAPPPQLCPQDCRTPHHLIKPTVPIFKLPAFPMIYFISCICMETRPYFFAFPSNSSMYLSKSDINNLSCITRYFSNSVSA